MLPGGDALFAAPFVGAAEFARRVEALSAGRGGYSLQWPNPHTLRCTPPSPPLSTWHAEGLGQRFALEAARDEPSRVLAVRAGLGGVVEVRSSGLLPVVAVSSRVRPHVIKERGRGVA